MSTKAYLQSLIWEIQLLTSRRGRRRRESREEARRLETPQLDTSQMKEVVAEKIKN